MGYKFPPYSEYRLWNDAAKKAAIDKYIEWRQEKAKNKATIIMAIWFIVSVFLCFWERGIIAHIVIWGPIIGVVIYGYFVTRKHNQTKDGELDDEKLQMTIEFLCNVHPTLASDLEEAFEKANESTVPPIQTTPNDPEG